MTWNYRIVRRVTPLPEKMQRKGQTHTEYFAIHEAYYDKEGRVYAITESPVPVDGETLSEVRETRMRMFEAEKRPVLDYDTVPEPGAINPADTKRTRKKATT